MIPALNHKIKPEVTGIEGTHNIFILIDCASTAISHCSHEIRDKRMSRRVKISEGKAKIIYEGAEPGTVIQYFKDDVESADQSKQDVIAGKGVLNNRISAHLMTKVESIGVPTHFIKSLNMREQVVREVDVIPVRVVIRNIVAGDLQARIGLAEGSVLPRPIVEFYYKNSDLKDPMVNDDHIVAFGLADPYELEEMISMAYRANDYMRGFFAGIGIELVDFKMEFGRIYGEHGELYLVMADEISPDSCRLWDIETGRKLDKDVFSLGLGDLTQAYEEIAYRLGLIPKKEMIPKDGFNAQLFENLEAIENELARHRKLKNLKKSKITKI